MDQLLGNPCSLARRELVTKLFSGKGSFGNCLVSWQGIVNRDIYKRKNVHAKVIKKSVPAAAGMKWTLKIPGLVCTVLVPLELVWM